MRMSPIIPAKTAKKKTKKKKITHLSWEYGLHVVPYTALVHVKLIRACGTTVKANGTAPFERRKVTSVHSSSIGENKNFASPIAQSCPFICKHSWSYTRDFKNIFLFLCAFFFLFFFCALSTKNIFTTEIERNVIIIRKEYVRSPRLNS